MMIIEWGEINVRPPGRTLSRPGDKKVFRLYSCRVFLLNGLICRRWNGRVVLPVSSFQFSDSMEIVQPCILYYNCIHFSLQLRLYLRQNST